MLVCPAVGSRVPEPDSAQVCRAERADVDRQLRRPPALPRDCAIGPGVELEPNPSVWRFRVDDLEDDPPLALVRPGLERAPEVEQPNPHPVDQGGQVGRSRVGQQPRQPLAGDPPFGFQRPDPVDLGEKAPQRGVGVFGQGVQLVDGKDVPWLVTLPLVLAPITRVPVDATSRVALVAPAFRSVS